MKSFAAAAILVAAPSVATAQEIEWRLDHRNQPSIVGGLAFEQLIVTASSKHEGNDGAGVFDIAFGLPVNDEGAEAFLGLRVGAGEDTRLVAPNIFYRVYAGEEAWKTYFDAGLMLRIEPLVAPSARIGLGLQYDFHENWGAWVGTGASVGYGQGLQVGIDGGAGLQFRFGTAG